MNLLKCDVQLPQEENQALTVGEVFELHCEGERPVFSEIELNLVLPKDKEFTLKILESSFPSESELLLKVASYVPGAHKLDEIYLLSGNEHVAIEPLEFSVSSVIDPQSPPEGPYPAKGPLLLGTPLWFYLALALPVILIVGAAGLRFFLYLRRRQMVESLKAERPAMGSYQNFNRELRRMQRKYPFIGSGEAEPAQARAFVEELDEAFQRFLEWHFLIPVKRRRQNAYMKEIKKALAARGEESFEAIRRSVVEIQRAKSEKSLSALDCRQLLEAARKAANLIRRDYRVKESA